MSNTTHVAGTSRRSFLKASVGATGLLAFPTVIPASALGKDGDAAPSERVNMATLGCGSRSGFAAGYNRYEKSKIIAVCDPIEERRLQKAKAWGVTDHYNDFRDLLARKDVDAVHIATADHWHVPLALAAARAGKDVYCEKPLGICIEQDLAARQIVEKYGRVFQYGTQQRSQIHLRLGIELVLNGHVGDLKEIHVWAPQGASGGSATPVLPVPAGYDYDLWLGPAPKAPFCNDRCLVQGGRNAIFHVYDYAIGFIAGWGAHPMDQLQWWADKADMGIPTEYKGTGVIPTEGLFNTITHWDVECTYPSGLKMFFMDTQTALKAKRVAPYLEKVHKFGNCTTFIGSDGWVAVSRGGWATSTEEIRLKAKDPGSERLVVSTNHTNNFVDSILKREQAVANLDSAVRSDIICHLSDIAIRTGETIGWDPRKETVVGISDAVKMMHRPMREPWDKLL